MQGFTRLLGGLGKGLPLHAQRAQAEHVRAEEARQRAAAVLDRKVGAVALRTKENVKSIADAVTGLIKSRAGEAAWFAAASWRTVSGLKSC